MNDPKWRFGDHALESTNRHLIQAALDFRKFGRAIGLDFAAPAEKRLFGEDQV